MTKICVDYFPWCKKKISHTHKLLLHNRFCCSFEKEVNGSNNVPGYRFTPPKNVFASVDENPENDCFCPHGPPCTPSGFFNVSLCQYGMFTLQKHNTIIKKKNRF